MISSRIYRPGEIMPANECRYCHGKGTLQNVHSSAWAVPRLIRVRCTHKVGDPYGFAEQQRDNLRYWLIGLGVGGGLLALALLLGGQG
ncbi:MULTISPECIES: hypothetical protein [unclassified Sphingobium]|uniref:hypothetical protein n=1 Tax=unclassified Sphingobium TaxID=2611147 RepID=UPI002224D610|nr:MULTISPECIES: hypothetical protein [unclassified Sphingobium]MCW2410856.1 hypothetical protein [Sphingobium sp. B8D3D]MCW2416854.1 hypothetical protein [Sphingobium sp. B8D3A]